MPTVPVPIRAIRIWVLVKERLLRCCTPPAYAFRYGLAGAMTVIAT